MGLYEVPLFVSVGFWDTGYVSQRPCVRYCVFIKSSLNILVRNASPRGPMCFRCLIFSLSCFFCVFVCRKLSPHLGVLELDHRCLLSLCYFFAYYVFG